jgi:hypothetical protein
MIRVFRWGEGTCTASEHNEVTGREEKRFFSKGNGEYLDGRFASVQEARAHGLRLLQKDATLVLLLVDSNELIVDSIADQAVQNRLKRNEDWRIAAVCLGLFALIVGGVSYFSLPLWIAIAVVAMGSSVYLVVMFLREPKRCVEDGVVLLILTVLLVLNYSALRRMGVFHSDEPTESAPPALSIEFDREAQPWESCSISLPQDQGVLLFMRRHSHPMLAEFDRKVRISVRNGPELVAKLPSNTGAQTKINVYWYPKTEKNGPFVRMCDRHGEYLFDLGASLAFRILRYGSQAYAAELTGSGEYCITTPKNGAPVVELGGKPATLRSDRTVKESGKYLGVLDGERPALGFVSSAEAKERKIEQSLPPWITSPDRPAGGE